MPFRTGLKTVLFFCVFLLAGMSAEAVEIRLKPLVRLHRPIVLLGDVAELATPDGERAKRLRGLELFPAPAPGTSRNVRQQEIRELLALNGVDPSECTLIGPTVLQIHADRAPAVAEVATAAGSAPEAAVSAPAQRKVADGAPTIVVATRNLGRGDIVREADVELRVVEGPVRGVEAVSQLRDAVGLEVARPITAGQVLDGRSLQRPVLVRRGQAVTVCARAQGVSVRTTAKALADGSRDDLILLESIETKQKFTARVVGPQQAEVYVFGGPTSRLSSAPAPAVPLR